MNRIQYIVYCAICSALLIVSKEFLSMIANVELVSFLLIMYALSFPFHMSITISIIFCFVQMILYGIGMWTPTYFIVWPALVGMTYLLRNSLNSNARCALYSGLFGLIFGFLFAIPYFFMSINTGIAYFMNGIIYDVIHGLSNYIIMTLLYDPIKRIFDQLRVKAKLF